MIRVVLVDDQALVRSGFRIILQSEPDIEVVGEAEHGEDALRLVAELAPDVVCMDVQMPVMDGLEAARRLRDGGPPRPSVLMLTTFDRDEVVLEALAAGASGFLLKTARAEHLIDAVRVLAAGEAMLSPDITRTVLAQLSAQGLPPQGGGPGDASRATAEAASARVATEAGLTEREREVLGLAAQGLSNAEIAARLFVGEATVKSHMSGVLQKLGVRDRIQAVVWAFNRGLVRPAPPQGGAEI